jgi:hypothetical protein
MTLMGGILKVKEEKEGCGRKREGGKSEQGSEKVAS